MFFFLSLWSFFRRPLDRSVNGAYVQVQIHQRYFWNREWGSFPKNCTEADVVSKTNIPVSSSVICYINCTSSNYPAGGVSTLMTTTDCDQNALIKSWSGERYDVLNLAVTTSITIGFASSAWFVPNLFLAAGTAWSVMNRLNLAPRPDGFINSSPVTNTLPVLFKPVGQLLVHVIQVVYQRCLLFSTLFHFGCLLL